MPLLSRVIFLQVLVSASGVSARERGREGAQGRKQSKTELSSRVRLGVLRHKIFYARYLQDEGIRDFVAIAAKMTVVPYNVDGRRQLTETWLGLYEEGSPNAHFPSPKGGEFATSKTGMAVDVRQE